MLHGKKIVVVMPAYNAERTLERVYREIPFEFVDDVILVDDESTDDAAELGRFRIFAPDGQRLDRSLPSDPGDRQGR
jgi:glycosyltransferase involved in cell wall biosynthesis